MGFSGEQAELIVTFADAYERPTERTHQKETIMFYTDSGGTQVQHPHLPGGGMDVSVGDIHEFDSLGIIDIRYGRSDLDGSFRVTNDGFDVARQIKDHKQALASPDVVPEEGKGMGFDWATDALPVLQTVDRLWRADPTIRGVNQEAIKKALGRSSDDMHTSVILRKLQEADFVIGKGAWQGEGPVLCEPTTKAFELLAGWPTERGDMALARFVEALETRIEATDDPVEKGRLRKLLDSVNEVGQGVMAGVLTNLITGA